MTPDPAKPPIASGLRMEILSAALRESGIGVTHQDRDLQYLFAENLPASWPAQDPVADKDEALPSAVATQITRVKRRVLSTGRPEKVEIGDGANAFDLVILPHRDNGVVDGVTTVVTDAVERRERERVTRGLLREINHRTNNLMAIVQAIAVQTAQRTGLIDIFLERFRGRLQAVASVQNLVTDSGWQGVRFRELVEAQLRVSGEAAKACLSLVGEDPRLRPNAALYLGLALHELIENALIHNAEAAGLPQAPARAALSARIEPDLDGVPELAVEWTEQRLAPGAIRAPQFGSMVLKRIAPSSVGGAASYSIGEETVAYRLNIPIDQFDLPE